MQNGPGPVEGMEQECRRASSVGGMEQECRRASSDGGMEQECRGASSNVGLEQDRRGTSSNGGLVHTSAALKLCCSAFPYLCLIIISKYNSNKE